jgi:hypothetical protein
MSRGPREAFSRNHIDQFANELHLYREMWGSPPDSIRERMAKTEQMLTDVRELLASANPDDLKPVECALKEARAYWKNRQ